MVGVLGLWSFIPGGTLRGARERQRRGETREWKRENVRKRNREMMQKRYVGPQTEKRRYGMCKSRQGDTENGDT